LYTRRDPPQSLAISRSLANSGAISTTEDVSFLSAHRRASMQSPPPEELLQCGVCYNQFDDGGRKPLDLGCGHCYCQACFQSNPSSFRRCPGGRPGTQPPRRCPDLPTPPPPLPASPPPECRARVGNPHVSINLLRLASHDNPALPGARPTWHLPPPTWPACGDTHTPPALWPPYSHHPDLPAAPTSCSTTHAHTGAHTGPCRLPPTGAAPAPAPAPAPGPGRNQRPAAPSPPAAPGQPDPFPGARQQRGPGGVRPLQVGATGGWGGRAPPHRGRPGPPSLRAGRAAPPQMCSAAAVAALLQRIAPPPLWAASRGQGAAHAAGAWLASPRLLRPCHLPQVQAWQRAAAAELPARRPALVDLLPAL
jgi:hypothetical protein